MKRNHKRKLKFKHLFLATFVAVITTIILTAGITYAYFAKDIKTSEGLMNRTNTGLVLLDDLGNPFFTFYDARVTEYTQIENISPHLITALVTAEDKEYYSHSGFSIKGITRAAYRNLMNATFKEGGSTITQGLIKNAILTPEKNLYRKYQEVILAIELNRRYDKNEIIEMYLNSVYFGEGAFGVYDAAKTYFGKEPKDLTLAESSLLVGLLPAPSALSPITNGPDGALQRQHIVLKAMADEQKITQEQYDAALAEKLEFNEDLSALNNRAPHFALYVREQLLKEFGEEKILRSGFRVKTTLNMEWQQYAESVVAEQVAKLKPNIVSNGAAVVLDPKNGNIKVMVGSHNWFDEKNGKINMATTPRQPGSSIKPIFYAVALDREVITPATLLNDFPKKYANGYSPKNYDGNFRGMVPVRRALANSLNLPAVDVADKMGLQMGITAGQTFGLATFSTQLANNFGLSMALGSPEIPLLEMTSAYQVFADKGQYIPATAILEIHDKFGNEVQVARPEKKRVLREESAFLISSILSDNNARAEMFGGALTINKTAAVKTGTSEYYRDALTLGYTPSIVVGVWVGNNDNTQMDMVAGSLGAAPIWKALILKYTADTPSEKFEVPKGVTRTRVCFVAAPYKPEDNDNDDDEEKPRFVSYEEYFIRGTEKNSCDKNLLEEYEDDDDRERET